MNNISSSSLSFPLFPIVQRVYAKTIASSLVSVQPMAAPTGQSFYLDLGGVPIPVWKSLDLIVESDFYAYCCVTYNKKKKWFEFTKYQTGVFSERPTFTNEQFIVHAEYEHFKKSPFDDEDEIYVVKCRIPKGTNYYILPDNMYITNNHGNQFYVNHIQFVDIVKKL